MEIDQLLQLFYHTCEVTMQVKRNRAKTTRSLYCISKTKYQLRIHVWIDSPHYLTWYNLCPPSAIKLILRYFDPYITFYVRCKYSISLYACTRTKRRDIYDDCSALMLCQRKKCTTFVTSALFSVWLMKIFWRRIFQNHVLICTEFSGQCSFYSNILYKNSNFK